jgi:transposase
MRVRPSYDEQFKESAVSLLEGDDRSLPQVARDLGVSSASLRTWYEKRRMSKKKKKPTSGQPLPRQAARAETAEQQLERLERENAALRRENESLKMDREILKKAAAFFAKESE